MPGTDHAIMAMSTQKLTNTILHVLLLGNFLIQDALGGLDGHCPPLGPVLPAPTRPSASGPVRSAVAALAGAFAGITAPLAGSAVSVSARSIHEGGRLVDLHHTPPARGAGSAAEVDGDAVYRVGSISKVFTVLGVLRAGIRMDDPVTLYLPELRDLGAAREGVDGDISAVRWDDITIGALASHMSGIGLDLMMDLANMPQPWTSLGFPDLSNASEHPGCQGLYGLPPCPESELYRDLAKHHPVYAPFTSPTYSNLGVAILGLVLERVSNATYAEFTEAAVLAPLGLGNTTVSTPPAPRAAFVPEETADEEDWWGVNLGWDVPAGGFYSTANDLLALGSAILDHSILGSTATRKWLKPVSSTSTVGRDMGAPWEILRSTNLTTDNRLVEIYTKGGDAGPYHSKLALVPDYDLVVAVLAAGPEADFELSFRLLSRALSALLPALERAGKDEAAARGLTGTFADPATNSTVALSTDDGPGLAVSAWTARGRDVRALYAGLAAGGAGAVVRPRLYPTGLREEEREGARWAWRAVFDVGGAEDAAALDDEFAWPGQSCQTWANMDRFPYGFRGIDDFVFTLGAAADGSGLVVQSLENRGFQVVMERSGDGGDS